MKVALIHDWLTVYSGAEQVLLALHELFPEAPIYTSIYNKERVTQFKDIKVVPSYLQKLPGATTHHQILIPLMPQAFESFDLREYDLIISSSTGLSKGVIVQPHQVHICYCHTPIRYLWHLAGDNRTQGWLRSRVAHQMRIWDVLSSQRVDAFVANSQTVADRIAKIYRRSAEVVYPPVNTDRFLPTAHPTADYFLSTSRFIEYKRLDIIIQACKEGKFPLKLVGSGPEEARMRALAADAPWIEFCGRVSDEELAGLYANAKAFLFAAEEDFGIVPVEAMSAGRPVIAYGKGGLRESVVEGKTGILYSEQNSTSLLKAIHDFEAQSFDSEVIRKHSLTFDKAIFQQRMREVIKKATGHTL